MNSREVVLWLDRRWIQAIEDHSGGKSIENVIQAHLDKLILTLPDKVRETIVAEIKAEDEAAAAQAEDDRRFSISRVTESEKTHIYRTEKGEETFQTAQRLRRYLRGEDLRRGMYSDSTLLTRDEMERYIAEAVRGSRRVVGVYDIDLDVGEFSVLDIKNGWQTYRVKDISTAVYFASKKESADWITKRDNFRERLKGLESLPGQRPVFIHGVDPFPVDKIRFEKGIDLAGRLLNFYIPVEFDPASVFGLQIKTEYGDVLNLYANYDMERGCVCDTLGVYLVRGDGSELDCQYRLTPGECAALLPKMDAYCKEQMGLSLEEARAQYLSEGPGDTPQVEVQQISPQQSGPMMQM